MAAIVLNQLQIKGTAGEFGLVQEVIEKISTYGLDLKPMITHRFKFNEAVEVIKTAKEKK